MTDFRQARLNMVESQIRPNQVTDSLLLQAMLEIPRERFVPDRLRGLAYMEEEILVSEPSSVEQRYLMPPMPFARLVQLAEVQTGDLVLDVGCATGYSTAILSKIADSIVGIECDEALTDRASQNLVEQEIDNAAVITAPLHAGYPSEGPYDVVLLNGCVSFVPETLLKQLKSGGRLVAVISDGNFGQATLYRKHQGGISQRPFFDAGCARLPGFEKEEEFIF